MRKEDVGEIPTLVTVVTEEEWKTFYVLVKTLATQLHASHTRPYYESANCIQIILKIFYPHVQEPGVVT